MAQRNYGLITSLDELKQHCDKLTASDATFAIDIETGYHGPDREKAAVHAETAFIAGFSFTNNPLWAHYVPIAHDQGENLDNYEVARLLWPVLNTGQAVAHNLPFELRHLAKFFRTHLADDPEYGEQVRASRGYFPGRSDTQVEAYLEASQPKFGLKPLVKAIFDHEMMTIAELFPDLTGKQLKCLRFNVLDQHDPKVRDYACEDSAWALALHERNYPLVKDMGLYRIEQYIVQHILPAMEDFGVAYHWARMRAAADELRDFRDRFNAEVMQELTEMAGVPIAVNLGSPPQIGKVLYDTLGMRTTVYTPGTKDKPRQERKMSTGAIALAKLAEQHPVVKRILQWREQTKLLGTYLDKYESVYNYADDGRAHPNHISAFVVTGRFAVSDPPYQQSPKTYHFDLVAGRAAHREHAAAHGDKCECDAFPPPKGTCFKHSFRDNIIAPPGYYILGFDLSQAELRAIAGEANETALLRAFAAGEDVHTLTAALMLGKPLDEVSKEDRAIGKAQPLDALILTPSGWRRMGELSVGDQVIGSNGRATTVTGVFPQGRKQVFRVKTSDGASTECCGEHLWTVQNVNTKSGIWVTKELRELLKAGLFRAGKGKYAQPKYKLPDRSVVQFAPGPELPIDPYVLGLLLGDGGFTHSWAPMYGSADRELMDAVRAEHEARGGIWASETEVAPGGFWTAYLSSGVRFSRTDNKIKSALTELGLMGKRSYEKFVPDIYLHAAPHDRLALLQGLLDTDGTVNASGAQFRVTSRALAEAVQFLARSLGGWSSFAPLSKPGARMQWNVYLRLPAGVCPFRLARKAAKWKPPVYRAPLTITAVQAVGQKETQCISVAAGDGLYVTDEFIYTHNTMNFALLYGMGVKSLADRLALAVEQAQVLYDKYFAAYPNIAAWSRRQVELGRRQGYVTSRFGRKLPIWEFLDDRPWMQQKGERACVNYPIQGGATGDYVKIAMVRAHQALRRAGLLDQVHLVMNIHDALEFYVSKDLTPQQVIDVLQPAVIFPVPGWPAMAADWHIGHSWGSPVEVTVEPGGELTVKGQRLQDLRPFIEVDEETGDEIEVLPEVDREYLTSIVSAPVPSSTVTITIQEMPDAKQWDEFLDYIDQYPGTDRLVLRTPEGDLEVSTASGIDASHLGALFTVLGPVELTGTPSSVDTDALGAGLTFT